MSITLVTGTPGAGKTLHAVSTLLPAFAAQKVLESSRRILVDGIKDLIVEHEMMPPTIYSPMTEKITCDGEGVLNWWEWCKPGDVIVIDEVQRMWRPRGNGSKVPQMIAELETHRHRGVDFIIITQHPMLLDQNVRRLVDRHIHIRRMWGGNRAVRYEWDHCSSPDKVGDAGKSYWPYPKDAFKYYKSAELHTKQGGKAPAALIIFALAVLALPAAAYFGVTGVTGMLSPVPKDAHLAASKATTPPPVKQAAKPETGSEAPGPVAAVLPAVVTPTTTQPAVVFQGCIATVARCQCFTVDGLAAKVEDSLCRTSSRELGQLVPLIQPPSVAMASPPAQANKINPS